jgi:threonine synthase
VEADQRAEFLEGVFAAARIDDSGTLDVMRRTAASTGMLVDPHTAVGLGAAEQVAWRQWGGPLVTLGPAHPAKFPDAVRAATGVSPTCSNARSGTTCSPTISAPCNAT